MPWRAGVLLGSVALLALPLSLAGRDGAPTDAAADVSPAGPSPASWPVPGSQAIYRIQGGHGDPGGAYSEGFEGTMAFRFTTRWQVTCDVAHRRHDEGGQPQDMQWVTHASLALDPPLWPTNVTPGQEVRGLGLGACGLVPLSTQVVGESAFAFGGGRPSLRVPSWHATLDDCGCHEVSAHWASANGLLLRASVAGRAGGQGAVLLATDALLA